MSFGLDDQPDNMRGALQLLPAHLNGLRPHQWGWKPSASCRSIRERLLPMSATDGGEVDAVPARAGTLVARRTWERCCQAGQVVRIPPAADPEWDQEGEVYGLRPGSEDTA